MPEVIEEGTFDPDEFSDELAAAPTNHAVGSRRLFDNDQVSVWEVRLAPGGRGAFHVHSRNYFWTVVHGGIGTQRSEDGTLKVRRYEDGETSFQYQSDDDAMIHDFENSGDTDMLFITVELLD